MKYIPVLILALILLAAFKNYNNSTLGAQTRSENIKGVLNLETSNFVIPDNNIGGSGASAILSLTTSFVRMDCQDPDGCTVEFSESSNVQGNFIILSNISSNETNIDFAADNFNLSFGDTIHLIFEGNKWILF